ncbi:Alpha-glucosidase [uncultured Defluviicoccus sp.]|uniref:Alpha-glucosidase n=1 Tax=metagenome TaxID=256318 RepID=A0A380TDN8_9ZZZZ|nr:Alpha-glucosidase [uncultured Defluviicoccus sp.]
MNPAPCRLSFMVQSPVVLSLCVLSLGWLASLRAADSGPLELYSPSKAAHLSVTIGEQGLACELDYGGKRIAELASPLPWAESTPKFLGQEQALWRDEWRPVWGGRHIQTAVAQAVTARFSLQSGAVGLLDIRLFDDGLGFRFRTENVRPGHPIPAGAFSVQVKPPSEALYYWPVREHNPIGPVSLEEAAKTTEQVSIPLVINDRASQSWMAFLESDLFSARLFSTMKIDLVRGEGRTIGTKSEFGASAEDFTTPWRVLLFGRSPAELLNNTVCLALAPRNQIADTSWIKPGLSTWEWRVKGYKTDGHVYGNDKESYLRFIRFARDNGIPYISIDDNWYDAVTPTGVVPRDPTGIAEVMRFAKESGVGVFVYYDRVHGTVPTDALFRQYAGMGAAGVKYGFMDDDPVFTREAIQLAAKHRLMINFHDGPVPMVGVERTFPNVITREYCHAQQDARRCFTPTEFLRIGIVNALTGPLDQANGAFGLNGINRGERQKGPLKPETYNSTVASEVARVLIVGTGLACLPDAPEEYLRKPDLFEFLKSMSKLSWDESSVLAADMGRRIVTARRSGDTWFVGAVMNEEGGTFDLPLDFLADGVRYAATVYADAPGTHYRTNREAYEIRHEELTKGQRLQIRCAPGGGQAIMLRPLPH